MRERSTFGDTWLLPIASLLVPLMLLAMVAWRDYDQAFDHAERHVERTGALVYEHTLRQFETFRFSVEAAAERIEGLSWAQIAASEEIHRYLARVDDGFSQVGSVWLYAPDGRAAISSLRFPAGNVSAADRDYFVALRDGEAGDVFISATYPGRTTGRMGFNVARRHSAPDGSFNGVILVAVYIQEFRAFFERVIDDPRDSVWVVRADGTVLALDREGPLVTLSPDSGFRRAVATAPEAGMFRATAEIDGVERIFAYRKLSGFPVYVVYGRAVETVREQWAGGLAVDALVAVPLALLLATVSWLVVRKARSERAAVIRYREEEARRRRAEELLEKVQRLEMLGQIAGGIAHDFNNLLMVITSNLYLAQARAAKGAEGAGPFIDTAMQAAYRGGQLTQQLLTFSRQQTLKPEAIDLPASLNAMVDGMLKRSLRGDIEVRTDLPPDTWPIEADRAQLELAVLNLAVNARDAMPGGGRLTVRAANVRPDGGPDAPAGLRGDFVALSVVDTGCGIDPAVRDRVFDPFFTTKEVGKGTGLGLSQVFGFASQSGGMVTLDSTVGQGTTVTLYLPRATGTVAGTTGSGPARLPDGCGRRILLVEDSPEIGRTTTTLLEGFGYTVTLVDNARAALDTLASGRAFDLVLSDIVMPGDLNGLDLARTVRDRYAGLPIMLTTGYSTAATAAVEDGFVLLHKPYRPEALAEAISDLLKAAAPGTA
ncbi:hybrid sensor histidine kinase/response regulator [Azospirillum halopraeferens]|uniref:hybrid sensor histidine kinase/response regulator n=1 Tax=Azospirillum halopraeferens TaxID=34010 RepID=UPI0003FA58D8|nr:hybrid sensor histidine kinase/response regulator [Azospirillum halopraeferens]